MQDDFCGLSSGENVSYQSGNGASQKKGNLDVWISGNIVSFFLLTFGTRWR
jgi:hypothetical protein